MYKSDLSMKVDGFSKTPPQIFKSNFTDKLLNSQNQNFVKNHRWHLKTIYKHRSTFSPVLFDS